MKYEKKELIFLGLSALVLLISSGVYFANTTHSQVEHNREISRQKEGISKAEELVQTLEANQTQENSDKAQQAVDKLANSKRKTALQGRINAVRNALQAQEAENARQTEAETKVSAYETNPSDDTLAGAQASVDALTDGDIKNAFQARIEAVKAAQANASTDTDTQTSSTTTSATQETDTADNTSTYNNVYSNNTQIPGYTGGGTTYYSSY